jgi:ketosteroid isomerase-like protein
MSGRDSIEQLIKTAYDARVRGDIDAVVQHFADGATFSLAGCPASSSVAMSVCGAQPLRDAMAGLVQSFAFSDMEPVTTVIEGDQAVIHWKARVRATATGQEAETEFVDILRVENGKIVSFKQFVDTALASRMVAAGATG